MELPRLGWVSVITVFAAALIATRMFAGQQEETLETARLLAMLLDSGRVTVAKHQDRINVPTQDGDTLTPALFERDVVEEFQRRTNVNLKKLDESAIPQIAKPLLDQLLQDSLRTIESFQPVLRVPGVRYKGLIPATFGTETAARFQRYSSIYMKQTAPAHLIRNPKNRPDDYEAETLARLAETSSQSNIDGTVGEIVDDGTTVRLMLPLRYGKSCLACHGEPKGERDISGYPREGAKEGDLGGAISVKIPLK